MELSIQERLKDLRVERGLTLEQLAEKTHLSKSALSSYEGDNLKDISLLDEPNCGVRRTEKQENPGRG